MHHAQTVDRRGPAFPVVPDLVFPVSSCGCAAIRLKAGARLRTPLESASAAPGFSLRKNPPTSEASDRCGHPAPLPLFRGRKRSRGFLDGAAPSSSIRMQSRKIFLPPANRPILEPRSIVPRQTSTARDPRAPTCVPLQPPRSRGAPAPSFIHGARAPLLLEPRATRLTARPRSRARLPSAPPAPPRSPPCSRRGRATASQRDSGAA